MEWMGVVWLNSVGVVWFYSDDVVWFYSVNLVWSQLLRRHHAACCKQLCVSESLVSRQWSSSSPTTPHTHAALSWRRTHGCPLHPITS